MVVQSQYEGAKEAEEEFKRAAARAEITEENWHTKEICVADGGWVVAAAATVSVSYSNNECCCCCCQWQFNSTQVKSNVISDKTKNGKEKNWGATERKNVQRIVN